MLNDPISRAALFNGNLLNKTDDTAKSDDINAFNKLLESSQKNSTSSDFSGNGRGSGRNNLTNASDSKSLLKMAREAAKEITDANSEAVAQRVVDQKNAISAQSSASAVKKAVDVFKEIKF